MFPLLDKYTRQTDGRVDLDPVDLPALRRLHEAISAQQLILDNLRYALEKQVEEKYGVDLKRETWELDLERGTLSKNE